MTRKRKRIIVFCIIIVIIVLSAILGNSVQKNDKEKYIQEIRNRVNQYISLDNFKSVEEVMVYLNTEFKELEDSNQEGTDYIVKVKFPYNLSIENKNYYIKIIHYTAYVLEYKNFYICDDENNIQILVICSSDKKIISEYYINENKFYFDYLENKKNIEEYKIKKDETSKEENTNNTVNVYAEVLQNIITYDWQTTNVDLGTRDSIYRNYDIYYDEGYEIRKIDGKVFNMIFTDKYTENVYGEIKVNTSNNEIVKYLGKPDFEANNVIGYKNDKFYIFFSENQISIYPIVKYDTEMIMSVVDKYKNSVEYNEYFNEIKKIWNDYDINEFSQNEMLLQYTLKGIDFQYNSSSERGVVIYNNYEGSIGKDNTLEDILQNEDDIPENIIFRNKNSVFEHEKNRINTQDDYTKYRNYTSNNVLNISNKFKTNVTEIQQNVSEIRFISINKECANTELREVFYYGIWQNDNTFIYSVKNKGIYKYNPETQQYSTIVEGAEDYVIKKIENDNLYYDETYLTMSKTVN